MVQKAENKYYPKTISFEVIVSSCNPEVAKRFVGIWVPVLRKMLSKMSETKKIKRTAIMNKLVAESSAADSKMI
jgi:hypothetical protein